MAQYEEAVDVVLGFEEGKKFAGDRLIEHAVMGVMYFAETEFE